MSNQLFQRSIAQNGKPELGQIIVKKEPVDSVPSAGLDFSLSSKEDELISEAKTENPPIRYINYVIFFYTFLF